MQVCVSHTSKPTLRLDTRPQAVRNQRRHLRSRGTTLLEIIITMAITTVAMLGYFSLHIRAYKTAGSALTMTQASSLATGLMDMLLTLPYEDSRLAGCGSLPVDPLQNLCKTPDGTSYINAMGTTSATDGNLKFFRSYWVETLGTSQAQKRITVRVRYQSELGRCPSCTSFRIGWKAVTMSSVRAQLAY